MVLKVTKYDGGWELAECWKMKIHADKQRQILNYMAIEACSVRQPSSV
jgi:hypothetical protein